MSELEEQTTGCIYGITSDFEVAKVWVKSCGSVVTLEHSGQGTKIEPQDQNKLVAHASQLFGLARAFKVPTMFSDSEESKRKIPQLEGKAARIRAASCVVGGWTRHRKK